MEIQRTKGTQTKDIVCLFVCLFVCKRFAPPPRPTTESAKERIREVVVLSAVLGCGRRSDPYVFSTSKPTRQPSKATHIQAHKQANKEPPQKHIIHKHISTLIHSHTNQQPHTQTHAHTRTRTHTHNKTFKHAREQARTLTHKLQQQL